MVCYRFELQLLIEVINNVQDPTNMINKAINELFLLKAATVSIR